MWKWNDLCLWVVCNLNGANKSQSAYVQRVWWKQLFKSKEIQTDRSAGSFEVWVSFDLLTRHRERNSPMNYLSDGWYHPWLTFQLMVVHSSWRCRPSPFVQPVHIGLSKTFQNRLDSFYFSQASSARLIKLHTKKKGIYKKNIAWNCKWNDGHIEPHEPNVKHILNKRNMQLNSKSIQLFNSRFFCISIDFFLSCRSHQR